MRSIIAVLVFVIGLSGCATPLEQSIQGPPSFSAPRAGTSQAYDIVRSLTTEVGARLAGTAKEKEARGWAVRKMRALGFSKVWTEEFDFPGWARGAASGEIISPYGHELVLTSLGGSIATPRKGIRAEVAFVASYDDLIKADGNAFRGKIVFVNDRMRRSRDGSGYSPAVKKRSRGAIEAAKRGAVAVLIRSAGTDTHRFAHTGLMRYDNEVKKIPAAALAAPDADQIERLFESGAKVVVKLSMQNRLIAKARSGNVIGDIAGVEKPNEIVLLAAHLDSWDLGTGAVDDGAGIAIVLAAALRAAGPDRRPKRTIRVVLYGAEEQGGLGGEAYAKRHAHAIKDYIGASEADFGAGRVWRLRTGVGEADLPFFDEMARALRPLGIERGDNKSTGGADIEPLHKLGVPIFSLSQDGTHYFDLHHTENDTLDKIEAEALEQNVEAYAQAVRMLVER